MRGGAVEIHALTHGSGAGAGSNATVKTKVSSYIANGSTVSTSSGGGIDDLLGMVMDGYRNPPNETGGQGQRDGRLHGSFSYIF